MVGSHMILMDSTKSSTYMKRQVGGLVLFSCIILGRDQ
jgi:hypothetical protein